MRSSSGLFVVACLLATSYAGAARQVNSVTVASAFNHRVFGAALMSACGRGETTPAVPLVTAGAPANQAALIDFLAMRRQSISCTDIPADVPVDGLDSLQRGSQYLIAMPRAAWAIAGPTWRAVDVLLGSLFGLSIALSYLLCRIAMGRVISAIVATLFMISPLHLSVVPDLRDYAKVPFFLASLVIVGLLVTRRRSGAAVVALAALAGAVVGFGFGVRTDVAINLIVVVVPIACFLPQPLAGSWKTRLVAVSVCVACFVAVAYPIIKTYQAGIPVWHVALLGNAHDWDETLGVAPAPYETGYFYSDSYVATQVDAYWSRVTSHTDEVLYGLPLYAEASRSYYFRLLRTFPADALLRGGAALIKILNLPFDGVQSVPMTLVPAWLGRTLQAAQRLLGSFAGLGVPLFAAVVLTLSISSVRLATLLFGLVVFLGAYPAIQFQPRHIVHLEVITLWMIGLTLSSAVAMISRRGDVARLVDPAVDRRQRLQRPIWVGTAIVALVFMPLVTLRAYQQRSATELFSTYVDAPVTPFTLTTEPESGGRVRLARSQDVLPRPRGQRSMYSEMIVADLSASGCPSERPALSFTYQVPDPAMDFTRTYDVAVPADGRTVRVFFPVFETGRANPDPDLLAFGGVTVDETERPCVKAIGRLAAPDTFPLLLPVVLPPDWRSLPLRQTLREWERPALSDDTRQRSYWSPAGLRVATPILLARLAGAGTRLAGTIEYQARIARTDRGDAVVVDGAAAESGSYLVAWRDAPIASNSVLVAEGTLERGGLTVGLVDAGGWADKIDVHAAGPFRLFVQAPRTGRYQVVVANNVSSASMKNRFTISRMTIVEMPHE